ncbi:MAG: hypothetical protein HQL71_09510 [Magnetococcales bacterium]|nr:hypothetical protein [Magnetococcales bacterium]
MKYTIKELIEKACAISIENAELAFALEANGESNSKADNTMQINKKKYAAALEALRVADPNGFEHNKAKVVEITRMATQQQKGSGSDY